MPRDITVTFSDGQTAVYKGAPDDVTPEAVTERAQKEFGKQVTALDGGRQAAGPEEPGVGRKILNSLGAGFGKVAAQMPRALGMVLPLPEEAARNLNTFSDQTAGFYDKLGEQGVGGLPGAALEGAAGAMAGGGAAAPVNALLSGAGGGVGSELAARTFGDNGISRLAGGLAGGMAGSFAASLPGRVRPNTQALAETVLKDVGEDKLRAAQAFQESAKKQGVSLDLSQALSAVGVDAPRVRKIRDFLADHDQGEELQKLLATQKPELDVLSTTTVGQLPGTVRQAGDAANNLADAATARIRAEKAARSAAVRGDYAKAGVLTEQGRQELIGAVRSMVTGPGISDEVKSMAAGLEKALSGKVVKQGTVEQARKLLAEAQKPSARAAAQAQLAAANAEAGAPAAPLHALDVDTAISDALGPFKNPLNPANPKVAGQAKGVAGAVNSKLQELSPEVAAAEAKYAALTESNVNPLKRGPVGEIAGVQGSIADKAAPVSRMESFFNQGVNPQASGTSPILSLAKELKATNPQAFPDAAKTVLSNRLNKIDFAGSKNPAADLNKAFFSDPARVQALRDTAAGIADSFGLDRAEVVRGLDNLARISKAAANRPQSVTGLNELEILQKGGQSTGANALRIFGFLPFERTARALENFYFRRSAADFDKLLTTPEGAATLARLGKMNPQDPKAIGLLANFNAQAAGAQPEGPRE